MKLEDIREQDWLTSRDEGTASPCEALFFYTPFCGTCQATERMLEVVLETMPPVRVRKINVNFAPALREEWRIASVPALVLLKQGEPRRTVYALRSAPYLYDLLREFAASPDVGW